jgi:hypothetical protein
VSEQLRLKLREVLDLIPELRLITCVLVWNPPQGQNMPAAVLVRPTDLMVRNDNNPVVGLADLLMTSRECLRASLDLSGQAERGLLALDSMAGEIADRIQAAQAATTKATNG